MGSSVLTCAWSVLFWYVFLVRIAYGVYGVPLGLGGAVYPVFFVPLVFAATCLYAVATRWLLADRRLSDLRLFLLGFAVPALFSTVGLLVFCPTDGPGGSFLELFWERL